MLDTDRSPSFTEIAIGDAFESWAIAVEGTANYLARSLSLEKTPFELAADAARLWRETAVRRPPTWATAHSIAFETPIVRLRDFSTTTRRDVAATLVLPPQAGHDPCIVDFAADQSQIRTIHAAGLKRVFVLDWKGATPATRNTAIEDYIATMERAVNEIGGPVNLIGDCQGGWLTTIFAALRPELVNTLTLAGAPVDFHAGEPVIGAMLDLLAPRGDLSFYRSLVAADGGVLRGHHMLDGFLAIQPQSEVAKQFGLMSNLDDAAYVERHRHFEDWFKYTKDIPGAFYLWIVERLFRDNALVRGELEVGGERVDLARIRCPLMLLGGDRDHITPPPQVFAAADYVGTKPEHITRRISSGGHLGLFMGHEALAEHWPSLLAEVREHS